MTQKGYILSEARWKWVRQQCLRVANFSVKGAIFHKCGESMSLAIQPPPLPIAPSLARITAIHNNYLETKIMQVAMATAVWSVPAAAPVTYVAKYPGLQKMFYNGKTITDPVTEDDVSFTYGDENTRTATLDSETESQRIVPWHTTDSDAPPIVIIPMIFPVLMDNDSTVLVCSHVDMGPAYWARYTP